VAEFACAPGTAVYRKDVPEEAGLGSEVVLDCSPGISVTSATYGRNCGAPRGNATMFLAAACDGKRACDYTVSVDVLGDPANGCGKDFVAEYECKPRDTKHTEMLEGEAGLGKVLSLRCSE
jgi:hypothetical protein